MNPDKLNEWRETMRQATERPWKSDGVDVFNLTDGAGQGFPLDRYPDSVDVVVGQCERCGTYEVGASPENLAAIVCAANNFEAVMYECERLRAEADKWRSAGFDGIDAMADKLGQLQTQLDAALKAKDEACRIATIALKRLMQIEHEADWQPDIERIAALREVGK